MKKLALCIGNDDYEILPRLNCCIADATAIEEQLKNLGQHRTSATIRIIQ